MTTMTLRGIDDNLATSLKEMAKQEGLSLNALALRLMREAAGIDKRKRSAAHHDLDSLAGTLGAGFALLALFYVLIEILR